MCSSDLRRQCLGSKWGKSNVKLGFKYGFGVGSFFNKEMARTYTSVPASFLFLFFIHELSKAQPERKA